MTNRSCVMRMKLDYVQLVGRYCSWDRILILIYQIDAHDRKNGNANARKQWKNVLHMSTNPAFCWELFWIEMNLVQSDVSSSAVITNFHGGGWDEISLAGPLFSGIRLFSCRGVESFIWEGWLLIWGWTPNPPEMATKITLVSSDVTIHYTRSWVKTCT